MPNEIDLQRRARDLRREIAKLDRAIKQMSAYNEEDRRQQLETTRTVRGLRERELNDVEAQLAAKS